MASGETRLQALCPVCHTPIELDTTVKLDMKRVVVGIDTAPIHAHVRDQHPVPVPALPTTAAARMDNTDATYNPSQPLRPLFPEGRPAGDE